MKLYAKVLALENVRIDDLSGVHYGNIDVNDQEPLDFGVYISITSHENEDADQKLFENSNCLELIRTTVSKEAIAEAKAKVKELEKKFKVGGDLQSYRKDNLVDKAVKYDECEANEDAKS